jgi:hypothetical protein
MARLFELAVEKGVDGVAALERLVALHERATDRSAAREFADAMARFQEECPPIRKTSTATVVTKSGGKFQYQYAELDEIARTVRPILHKHGLSYSWDNELSQDGNRIKVRCVVKHANGHQTTSTFEAPTSALTQAMSKQQEVAAALTFGRRQTLIQALGLTTTDPDSDGPQEPEACITADQVLLLEDLADRAPSGTRARLLAYIAEQWGCESIDCLPASRFEEIKAGLEKKIAR